MIAPPRSFALRPHGIARFEDGAVVLLDQTQLPAAVVEVRLVTWQEVAEAIRGLVGLATVIARRRGQAAMRPAL